MRFFFRELVPCKLFQGKKNSVFYFFPICGKKTQIEKIELVSNPQTFPGKKKNTIPLHFGPFLVSKKSISLFFQRFVGVVREVLGHFF